MESWRWERQAEMAAAKLWARARQRPPLSEGARHGLGASVRTVRLTGWAPRGFDFFFQFIKNRLKFKNSKWVPYIAPKILNFCTLLA
jgi:hypothetical protein